MIKNLQFKAMALTLAWATLVPDSQADVVVVASAKSDVSTLTQKQVTDLFLGKIRAFPNGNPAITAIIESGPLRDEFLSMVLDKTDSQARSTWSRLVFTGTGNAPKEVKDSTETKKLIAHNPNIVGVIDKSALDASVKVIFAP
ncbi:MAG: phosphate ABC transporter substrate-binding protein [Aquabacterium sp.]|uniref:phosphate ABC transporter substrate-binding protein n=1 Tax=Aquabacterium sp. TaxID=1872578 RepID=UPI0025C23271|nr:phosphate ABC transporter substrate-binding protein [Aquabacterium sp.]MBI5925150.1 phosphate ABC transporter substrate-binding protein [Aquabacterium sp.]